MKLMAISLFQFLLFQVLFPRSLGAGGQDETCKVSRCGDHGLNIRFPFWLKDTQPENCGYREFELFCNQKQQIMLELPFSVKLMVNKINYKSQTIHVYDPHRCLPRQLPKLNLSASPFHFIGDSSQHNNYALFNCSPPDRNLQFLVPCLGVPGYKVYATAFFISGTDMTSCVKINNILSVPYVVFDQKNIRLSWSEPNCSKCEDQGKMCSLKNNHTTAELECLYMPKMTNKGASRKLMVIGLASGVILLPLVVIVIHCVYTSKKINKEDQVNIKTFLEDYAALKPSRYTFADIKKITNQFKDKVGEGCYGTVFKGKLSNEISVAVRVLSNSIGNGEEFINEVATMGRIHHINMVRLVGFCADGTRRALIYEFLPNELATFIFSKNQNNSLGWEKLKDIALGVAKGIEYLHLGCDHRILHLDINPCTILLDHNFNPKIVLCSKEQSARGTIGYIAPEVFSRNFENVSYKSDVYSFGMLLLETVGGGMKFDFTVQNTSQTYFNEWIYNRLCREQDIEIHIDEDEHAQIAKKMTVVGLWCIQWNPIDRPSMKTVVQMLEGKGALTIPPNPFGSTLQIESSNAE